MRVSTDGMVPKSHAIWAPSATKIATN
jgi:hypothetical protein